MRLEFVKGKQKELIKSLKKDKKLTWKQLAILLNIKEGRLMTYSNETSLISNELYNQLDEKKRFSKFILGTREDNWGQVKGGKNSIGNTKKIKIPEDSLELAEFYGIMLGDGNSHRTKLYRSREYKRGTYMVRIVGDSRKDREYLINYVKPIIKRLFGVKVNIKISSDKNVIVIESYGTNLITFLEKKGFPPGNKISNKLRIPNWIKNNDEYLKACIRGLYDTDGSVYKITNQNSHQFCFTNYNLGLLEDVRDGLLKLGIICSKISKGTDIYITKKSELRKFLKLIGFSNYKHLKKIEMWNLNSPVV